MPTSELKFGVDNDLDNAPKLSEEDLHAIKQRMEVLDKLLATEQKAKFKIEVLFGSARLMSKPTPGAMSFWESGTKLHGGGDAKLYICAGKTSGQSDCQAFIPDLSNGYGHLVCPKCQQVWKGEDVTGEIFARLSMRGWSELILKYFMRLDHNSDIYIKHAKTDVRSAAQLEQGKRLDGEKLTKYRSNRAIYVYPLRNIVRDTCGGSDLLGRFYALLTA